MWGTWSLSFLISGVVFWLPFIVWRNLFAGRPASPEIAALFFWWLALMGLSLFLSIKDIDKRWRSAISVVLGFSIASQLRVIISLADYPIPASFYLTGLMSALIHSGLAACLGVFVGSFVHKRRK
jgi:hypothetical protein